MKKKSYLYKRQFAYNKRSLLLSSEGEVQDFSEWSIWVSLIFLEKERTTQQHTPKSNVLLML